MRRIALALAIVLALSVPAQALAHRSKYCEPGISGLQKKVVFFYGYNRRYKIKRRNGSVFYYRAHTTSTDTTTTGAPPHRGTTWSPSAAP